MSVAELKVEKLVEGMGAAPKAGNIVQGHYTGWLTDRKSVV